MRAEVGPPSYGLFAPAAFWRNAGLSAVSTAVRMLASSASQHSTLAQMMRPFCRAPMFTAGTRKVGVSTTPEEELPTTAAAYFMAER